MPDPSSILLEFLSSGAPLTQAEAVRRLRLSERTARRHLRRLELEGIVEVRQEGRQKRYYLRPEHRPMAALPVKLTEGEAEALTVAVLAARDLLSPTPFNAFLATAYEKLKRTWIRRAFSFEPEVVPDHWNFDDVVGGTPASFNRACFASLLEAVRNCRPVRVTYLTASRNELSTDRMLHPLGFHVRAGSWMVAAFDPETPEDSQREKDFAIAGFKAVEVLRNETFAPPVDFDLMRHARDRFRAVAGEETYEIRLQVEPEAAPYFRRKHYHPTQQIEADRGDGRLIVSFEVEGLEDMAAWVLSWGPKVRVLAPAELIEWVVKAHRDAVQMYELPGDSIPGRCD